eukprot:414379-Rhodomonas_salina.1
MTETGQKRLCGGVEARSHRGRPTVGEAGSQEACEMARGDECMFLVAADEGPGRRRPRARGERGAD